MTTPPTCHLVLWQQGTPQHSHSGQKNIPIEGEAEYSARAVMWMPGLTSMGASRRMVWYYRSNLCRCLLKRNCRTTNASFWTQRRVYRVNASAISFLIEEGRLHRYQQRRLWNRVSMAK